MAARLTEQRFSDPAWIFERKYDGIRLLAFKNGSDVGLYSRNRLPQHLPQLADAIAKLDVDQLILDGELTWGERGAYHVFDVMWLDGRDLTALPLDDRRAILLSLALRPPLHPIGRLDAEKPWEQACAEGWEGVIAKRRDSRYEHR